MSGKGIWVALTTIVGKEVTRFLRVWSQTLLPPVVTTSLYFLIFGAFIGSQVKPINGFSYMQFIVPGLVMMSVITSAFQNTVSSFYFAKFHQKQYLKISQINLVVLFENYRCQYYSLLGFHD